MWIMNHCLISGSRRPLDYQKWQKLTLWHNMCLQIRFWAQTHSRQLRWMTASLSYPALLIAPSCGILSKLTTKNIFDCIQNRKATLQRLTFTITMGRIQSTFTSLQYRHWRVSIGGWTFKVMEPSKSATSSLVRICIWISWKILSSLRLRPATLPGCIGHWVK